MTNKSASDKGSQRSAGTSKGQPAKATPRAAAPKTGSPKAAPKAPVSKAAPPKAAAKAPVERQGKRSPWSVVLIVVIVLAVLCACTLAVTLWFTGDSILNFLMNNGYIQ